MIGSKRNQRGVSMTEKYKLLFNGEFVQGQDPESVKKNLSALFKTDIEKINQMLSSMPVLIRKDMDLSTASRYKETLEKAGALCCIEEMAEGQETNTPPAQTCVKQKYDVVFHGELLMNNDLDQVKKGMANLYKTDMVKIEQLFAHLPAVIRREVDLETASMYREMMKQVGAICLIRPVQPKPSASPVSSQAEKPSVNAQGSASPKQTVNSVSSANPTNSQQVSAAAAPSQNTENESIDRTVSNDEVAEVLKPSGTKGLHDPEPACTPPGCITCPQCHFEQPSSGECTQCGFALQDASEPEVHREAQEKAPDPGTAPSTPDRRPQGFLGTLFNCEKPVAREMKNILIGSAIIGLVVGFFGGGLFDPWGKQGLAAAILNFFLFGGWALAEDLGLLYARNLKGVRTRMKLILVGALWGGLWVSFFYGLESFFNPVVPGTVLFSLFSGLIGGMIIGFIISAICTIKLSDMMLNNMKEGIVSPTSGEMAGKKGFSNLWKVLVGVGVGFAILVLLLFSGIGLLVGRVGTEFESIGKEKKYQATQTQKGSPEASDMPQDKMESLPRFETSMQKLLEERYPSTDFSTLISIDLSYTNVRDLSPIKGLKNLSALNLSHTQVSDLTPLGALKNLSFLNLCGTQVSDVSPLRKLQKVTELHLGDTQVRDFTPLKDLKKLRNLYLYKGQVSEKALNKLRKAMPGLEIRLQERTKPDAEERISSNPNR